MLKVCWYLAIYKVCIPVFGRKTALLRTRQACEKKSEPHKVSGLYSLGASLQVWALHRQKPVIRNDFEQNIQEHETANCFSSSLAVMESLA